MGILPNTPDLTRRLSAHMKPSEGGYGLVILGSLVLAFGYIWVSPKGSIMSDSFGAAWGPNSHQVLLKPDKTESDRSYLWPNRDTLKEWAEELKPEAEPSLSPLSPRSLSLSLSLSLSPLSLSLFLFLSRFYQLPVWVVGVASFGA